MNPSVYTTSAWLWSEEHNNYYRCIYDANNQLVRYEWANATSADSTTPQSNSNNVSHTSSGYDASATAHTRSDLVVNYDANMAPSTPASFRNHVRLKGTPERGWYDPLDSSYRMRTKGEASMFFVQGRVFAMLWVEAASATMAMARNGTENTAVTIGRFGEGVYSQIRRFVIVKVNRKGHFVYACPIYTYSNQGTMKPGCNASEHTIVYLTGSQPDYIPGEWERGMIKEPIEIEPKEPAETMHPASRLRLGKYHSIEWNVKVREIGQVSAKHMSKLVRYYKEEEENGCEIDYVSDGDGDSTAIPESATPTRNPQPSHAPINQTHPTHNNYSTG